MENKNLKDKVKSNVPCTDFLKKAKNYSSSSETGYCCPSCGSGTHGPGSTGAVKYYKETNTWCCHSCGETGDVIDVYMYAYSCDYTTAVRELAKMIGEYAESVRDKQMEARKELCMDYAGYYEVCQKRVDADEAVRYLMGRGIMPETIERFGIGYDPAADPASAPGATDDAGKKHPAPRVIIPCSRDYYVARSIKPETPAQYKAPNPQGSHTRLFNPGALYRKTKVKAVFICEGVFDAISMEEIGYPAVAMNGKGNGRLLTAQLQEKATDAHIIIVPDNDEGEATRRQAEELRDELKSLGAVCSICNVAGAHHDPNEALVKDRTAFEEAAAKAIVESGVRLRGISGKRIQAKAGITDKPEATGLRYIDDLLGGGMKTGSLSMILGPTGVGKTTLAQCIAEALAAQKQPVVYYSLEMYERTMLDRALSAYLAEAEEDITVDQIADFPGQPQAVQNVIEQAWNRYEAEREPFIAYNPEGMSTDPALLLKDIFKRGKEATEKGEKAPVVILDYLQRLDGKSGQDIKDKIKKIAEALKAYALRYDAKVVCLSAVNRESSSAGEVTVTSGRDSSNIEYNADYVIGVQVSENRQELKIRSLKNRYGAANKTIGVYLDGAHGRICAAAKNTEGAEIRRK